MQTGRSSARVAATLILLLGWTGSSAGSSAEPPRERTIDESTIDALTVDERIGRLLFVAFTGTTPEPDLAPLLDDLHPGGVLFYSRNIGTIAQLRTLTARARSGAHPPLIGIDEEGGFVTRMPAGLPQLSSAMALGATRSEELAFEQGREAARCLRSAGFDFNLAPVLDVHSSDGRASLGTRLFSDDPEIVSALGAAFIRGAAEEHVISAAKHFPGIGGTDDDSHKTTPRLRDGELSPFRAAVRAGVPAMMTAHAIVERVDAELPVSISPAWHDVIRRELAFDGVILTDALQMAGLPKAQGIGRAAVDAFLAGSDMLVVGWNRSERITIRDALREAYQRGEISEMRLRASLRRILALHLLSSGAWHSALSAGIDREQPIECNARALPSSAFGTFSPLTRGEGRANFTQREFSRPSPPPQRGEGAEGE